MPITIVIRRRKSRSRFDGVCPSTRASPAVGYSRPDSILSVVVLPAPLGPRKPTTSPAAISKLIPSTAWTWRVSRRTRLRVAARTPPSRTGTSNVLRSSTAHTRDVGGADGADLGWREAGGILHGHWLSIWARWSRPL